MPKLISVTYILEIGGARWRSCLMHWATSRKVAIPIPDGVIGIIHWRSPSGRTRLWGVDAASNRNVRGAADK